MEASKFFIENKSDANPENTINIMKMTRKRIEIVSGLINANSPLLEAINNIHLKRELDIISVKYCYFMIKILY